MQSQQQVVAVQLVLFRLNLKIMEKLNKLEGKYYTQNIEELPIEERVFFREGIVANMNDFRVATDAEIANWEEYQHKLEETE